MSFAKSIPPGTIVLFGGSTAPNGWLICDGRELVTASYPDLARVLNFRWGGNGSTRFNLPDMRGVFARGYDVTANRDPNKTTRTSLQGATVGSVIGSYQSHGYADHSHTSITFDSENDGDRYHSHSNLSDYEYGHWHKTWDTNFDHMHGHTWDWRTYNRKISYGGGKDNPYRTWETYPNNPASKLLTSTHGTHPDHTVSISSNSDSHSHTVDNSSPSHGHTVLGTVDNAASGSGNETRPKNVYVNYIIKI